MDKHQVLLALGPGGTTDLAERVLAMLQERDANCLEAVQLEAVQKVLGDLELGGLAEVCTVLGSSRQTVGHWIAGRRRPHRGAPDFPEPLVVLSATPVWDLATVREWRHDAGL